MKFTTAAACEQIVWEMRLADFPRADNRARLDELYNGAPPYTEEEERQNRIVTNVNHLEGTKLLHDARRQFEVGFNTADPLFTVNVDYGPPYKRRAWEAKITREMGRIVSRSRYYDDVKDSTFASLVLHGIGPVVWETRDHWCPDVYGIEDILIPSNTLVSMKNLPFFAVYRQDTGKELQRLISGPRVDKAWNMELAERLIAWVDTQASQLMSSQWPEVWSPEKMQERYKQDGGLYMSDAVPTIDTFDLYYWDDEGGKAGWKRKVVLDAWGEPGVGGAGGNAFLGGPLSADASPSQSPPARNKYGADNARSEFLYDSQDRIYAEDLGRIAHWQFADASAVAPFRYHSVRSLGFMLYAVSHLQNRLRCKFSDAVFESLLQYLRVNSPDDAERALKVELVDRGVIAEGVHMLGPNERWQYNERLAVQALQLNRQTMADNSASYTQDFDGGHEGQPETATRTMAKVNATAALVGAMLNKAYKRQTYQYEEIARRFALKNSRDPEVRKFRVEVLKAGIPEEALNAERWTIHSTRVLGNGNTTLQILMADKLMAVRPLLDPSAQKEVDRIYITANTGNDAELANKLVPEQPTISDSIHDAQLSVATILRGLPITMEDGQNHEEYIKVWLNTLGLLVKQVMQRGGVATPEELMGFNNLAQHISAQLRKFAQDRKVKAKAKQYGDALGKLMNQVKAFAQRLQAARKKQMQAQAQPGANGGGGLDPKDAAKIQATILTARTKAKLREDEHTTKQAQEEIRFQQELQHDAQRAQQEARERTWKAFQE